jgi:hypothetical protein
MTKLNQDPSEDIINLDYYGAIYALSMNNLLNLLDGYLKENKECATILNKYDSLSDLVSKAPPGPGVLEIVSPLYFWTILLEIQKGNNTNTLILESLRVNNSLLQNISNNQVPKIFKTFNSLDTRIVQLNVSIVNRLSTVLSTLNQIETSVLNITTQIIEYIRGEVILLLTEILSIVGDINNNLINRFQEVFDEKIEQFSEETSEKASLKIVGASYYKWDSENIYAPTLTFMFEEDIDVLKKRRTQVSVKLPYTRETIPTNIVEILAYRIESQEIFSYERGSLKSTYVDPTHRWRTTFNVTNKRQSLRLLKYIAYIAGLQLPKEGLSYTEGRRSLDFTRLQRELINVKLRERFNEGNYVVKLFRVVLLINNAESPIIIWKEIR